jgi:mono/diheme cytochrome c family protein
MKPILLLSLGVAGLALTAAGYPADPERGRILYSVLCVQCHTESVHGRQRRAAKDYDEVRQWVRKWNNNLGGFWRSEEIDDVTAYLNDQYYKYPCTGPNC